MHGVCGGFDDISLSAHPLYKHWPLPHLTCMDTGISFSAVPTTPPSTPPNDCPRGYWGVWCRDRCQCNQQPCNRTGVCLCGPCFTGPSCNQSKPSNPSLSDLYSDCVVTLYYFLHTGWSCMFADEQKTSAWPNTGIVNVGCFVLSKPVNQQW